MAGGNIWLEVRSNPLPAPVAIPSRRWRRRPRSRATRACRESRLAPRGRCHRRRPSPRRSHTHLDAYFALFRRRLGRLVLRLEVAPRALPPRVLLPDLSGPPGDALTFAAAAAVAGGGPSSQGSHPVSRAKESAIEAHSATLGRQKVAGAAHSMGTIRRPVTG